MKMSWGVSVYCRHEREILLAHDTALNRWDAFTGKIRKGETPLAAASRVVEHHLGERPMFPPIHQVIGAPSGLLLYTEYAAAIDEMRMAFVFMAHLEDRPLRPLDKTYDQFQWVASDRTLPRSVMPYVEGTISLAFMAIALDGVPKG